MTWRGQVDGNRTAMMRATMRIDRSRTWTATRTRPSRSPARRSSSPSLLRPPSYRSTNWDRRSTSLLWSRSRHTTYRGRLLPRALSHTFPSTSVSHSLRIPTVGLYQRRTTFYWPARGCGGGCRRRGRIGIVNRWDCRDLDVSLARFVV